MVLNDSMSHNGMKTYSRILRRMDADPKIKAILLNIDSGGGQATAGFELFNTLKDIRKPVFVHTHMLASGALMGTLPAYSIYAQSDSTWVGSIGAMISIDKTYLEMLKEEIAIYADTSPDKNKEIRALVKDNDQKPFIKRLNKLDNTFMTMVKEHRDLKTNAEDTLKGGLFDARESLERGLIDGIGTRREFLNRIKLL
jgi:protease-4